jgi:hypothetical protein
VIKRYILHIEFHWGRWPTVLLREFPKPGDEVVEGDVPGRLVPCRECGTSGFLFEPKYKPVMRGQQRHPTATAPVPTGDDEYWVYPEGPPKPA